MSKRPCPACAEIIDSADAACRFCGESLREVTPPQDAEHLRLLSTFHYVVGGLTGLLACLFLIHVGMGLAMVFGKMDWGPGPQPPAFFGWFVVAMGGFAVAAGWTLAILMILGGRNLARRRKRGFCTVVAALSCLMMPFGTILGVFTLMVLNRPTVRRLFDAPHAENQP